MSMLLSHSGIISRSIAAGITSLVATWVVGKPVINKLKSYKVGQVVRNDGPQSHLGKKGTPTMGGLIMVIAIFLALILFAHWHNPIIWLSVVCIGGYSLIGGYDDFCKLKFNSSAGLKSRYKALWQLIIAIILLVLLYLVQPRSGHDLNIPFIHYSMPLGFGIYILGLVVLVGSSNAVNLTDGLDGLVIVPIILVTIGLCIIAYLSSVQGFAHYFHLPYLPHAGEWAVIGCAVIGSSIGFLWFNCYPAQVFMGDVGSLSLGAWLGLLAVMIHQEIILAIMGLVFVVEAISVMLQVSYFKYTRKKTGTGKRIFKMAPLHHHFELSGWAEPKVIVRTWIITVLCVAIGLAIVLA